MTSRRISHPRQDICALFETTYAELRRLARARLFDGGRNAYLDTTALVHESYLRFQACGQLQGDGRRAFFAYASKVMRAVIVDTVRRDWDKARLLLFALVQD